MLDSTLGSVALPASKPHLQSLLLTTQGPPLIQLRHRTTFLLESSVLLYRPLINVDSFNVFTTCESPSSMWRIEEKVNSTCLLWCERHKPCANQHRRDKWCYRTMICGWCEIWRKNRRQSYVMRWIERPHGMGPSPRSTSSVQCERLRCHGYDVGGTGEGFLCHSGIFWYWCYAYRMQRHLTNDLTYEGLARINGFGPMFSFIHRHWLLSFWCMYHPLYNLRG